MTERKSIDQRFNAAVLWLAEHGVGVAGARVLEVTGRSTGLPRRAAVNPVTLQGNTYLVAPRGKTQWVRNVMALPQVRLGLGRTLVSHRVRPVPAQEAAPVLRAYLKRWGWQVGSFFPDGVDASSPDAVLVEAAASHPVFVLEQA
ncbi:nitroreductase family deazaflavin-dependent oxidoreductase [Dermacoccaceae bacterium W4C1]